MKKILLLITLTFFSLAQANINSGQFLGRDEFNMKLDSRLGEGDATIEVLKLFGHYSIYLTPLLGVFTRKPDGQLYYENGTPNPVNALIYQILADHISQDLSKICTSSSVNKFNPYIFNKVTFFCNTDFHGQPDWEEQLINLWYEVTLFEFPEQEFFDWKKTFFEQEKIKGKDLIYNAFFGLFYNPYFLLKQ